VVHKMCEPKIIEMLEYFAHDGDATEVGECAGEDHLL